MSAGVRLDGCNLARVVRPGCDAASVDHSFQPSAHRVGGLRFRRARCAPNAAATRRPSAVHQKSCVQNSRRCSGTGVGISSTSPAPAMPIWPARLHELHQVIQVQIVRAEVGIAIDARRSHRRTRPQTAATGRRREAERRGPPAPRRESAANSRVAGIHRSVAQTSTPNSRARKIDDFARPQPKSSTRIPGRKSSCSHSHSVIHSGLLPIAAFVDPFGRIPAGPGNCERVRFRP